MVARKPYVGSPEKDGKMEAFWVPAFLKGEAPYPQRWKQGKLEWASEWMAWRPSWSLRKRPLALRGPRRVMRVREVGGHEWQLKPYVFAVVECEIEGRWLSLAVPRSEVELVFRLINSPTVVGEPPPEIQARRRVRTGRWWSRRWYRLPGAPTE